jgi:uncharacterized protein (DUF302 family)
MVDILKKELSMEFDDAVEHVKKTVEEEGFSVMLVQNISEVFKKKLGVKEYERYTFILACNPKFAKAALDVSKNTGLLFPCSFAVYEDQGKIYVGHASIMKIAPEVGLAPADKMNSVIEDTGKAVHAAWDKL